MCGEPDTVPRHARKFALLFGDLAALNRQIAAERTRVLAAFREDVALSGFPSNEETASLSDESLHAFIKSLDG